MVEGLTCHACGNVEFDNSDGFYYCRRCGSQADDIMETGVADEDFMNVSDARGAIYLSSNRRPSQRQHQHHSVVKTEPFSDNFLPSSHSQSQSHFWRSLTQTDNQYSNKPIKREQPDVEESKPSVPYDFASTPTDLAPSPEQYCSEIRIRYVMGIQLMIQFQCQALVDQFSVSPLICGLAGVIWMRFVAASRVFDVGWADKVIEDSEVSQKEGELKVCKPRAKYSAEPHNILGQRAVVLWFRSLKRTIPISYSLAVSFLACHLAREAILPTDIFKWSLEGKLPYLSAFEDIEKCIGHPSSACPLSSSFMFKPLKAVGVRKLESLAASVAQAIGLQLPSVNFHAIANRYLKELSLPIEKIFPHASRIYEWLMPPELWMSANQFRLPTRVCVMSILIVAIRILYNVQGFGMWEKSFSDSSISSISCDQLRSSSAVQKSELDTEALLRGLEATYDSISDSYEYSKNLKTYLKYSKDVVFAGLAPSFEDNEEERIIEQLWDFYENQEDSETLAGSAVGCKNGLNQKRLNEGSVNGLSAENKKPRGEGCNDSTSIGHSKPRDEQGMRSLNAVDCSLCSQEQNSVSGGCTCAGTLKDRALRRMKANMEDNRFLYIPPRVNLKRFDYLRYVRKNDGGTRTYAAHADYYILLRACARVAQVDIRYMHVGVLILEKSLAQVENRIDQSLNLRPPELDSLGS
ncbi:TATA box-binding protein-associated factor RNA polymerase I subunit B-like [Telopea speciosissima]|uniref:TATA box-binding protein-associated factor RNA polymerase I subunit B-like n=1 Tax=Telopea speciosissima TaxID=54955 RepID=UPI001CC3E5FA|nr:TATA box-binding protein-associated factor RNA polymerase I subunit B-like [Telopea speciosissima]